MIEPSSSPSGGGQRTTSYKYGDGLVPGKHRVSIHYAVDAKGVPLVPVDYASANKSPLIV